MRIDCKIYPNKKKKIMLYCKLTIVCVTYFMLYYLLLDLI